MYASVANPTIRRHELMVRTRGYEEVADRLGYESLFLTLTAPSKYHATTRHGHHNGSGVGRCPMRRSSISPVCGKKFARSWAARPGVFWHSRDRGSP
ncbi:replication endonuclease [Serratia marcescens]|uniref:replication endonuclease n=1 Tax=Serratia marcescens TaxID=615 RepID=UPI003D06DDA7